AQRKPLELTLCPARYAEVPQGSACPPEFEQGFCGYPEGMCACTRGHSGQPQHALQWVCGALPPGCPARPPEYGARCAQPQVACDYGTCWAWGASTALCDDYYGYWSWRRGGEKPTCP